VSEIDVDAVGEAHRLGHDWLGPEHLVLYVARMNADRPATRALRRAGITPQVVEEALRRMDEAPPPRERLRGVVRVSPATSQVMAFAAGLAAPADDAPSPEQVLVGYLWQRRDSPVELLPHRELRVALADGGVELPAVVT
jgi:hypothetical protein